MNILVTGGLGYIGSHTCVALLDASHQVIIADNLSNSDLKTVDHIRSITGKSPVFYKADVTDADQVDMIFKSHPIDGVIHFAGYKSVAVSILQPLLYYHNNIVSTIILAKVCEKYGVRQLIFSSSATVYGMNKAPFVESMDLKPALNPYGETKVMCEKILTDYAKANQSVTVVLLRYFNPIGAHISGLIGEKAGEIPNNLMPYITKVAKGSLKKLSVFGDDYPTADGTCIRDYIHVVDLAEGHIAALNQKASGVHIYNLGTGKGTSVLELLRTFEKVNQMAIPFEMAPRRDGDIDICYADVSKAKNELNWTAKKTLGDMCRDSWTYEKQNTSIL